MAYEYETRSRYPARRHSHDSYDRRDRYVSPERDDRYDLYGRQDAQDRSPYDDDDDDDYVRSPEHHHHHHHHDREYREDPEPEYSGHTHHHHQRSQSHSHGDREIRSSHGDRERRYSDTRSHHSHHSHNSEKDVKGEVRNAVMAAVTAGAVEAFRVRHDPHPWTSASKGGRVATAALSAAVVDAAADKNPENKPKTHAVESAVVGLLTDRLVHGKSR